MSDQEVEGLLPSVFFLNRRVEMLKVMLFLGMSDKLKYLKHNIAVPVKTRALIKLESSLCKD